MKLCKQISFKMLLYEKKNRGYNYILAIINIFFKSAWAIPVKSKTADDVTTSIKSVLTQELVPKNVYIDRGKEFYDKRFTNFIENYNISLYTTFSNFEASICERFNRTLKNKMWIQFTLHANYKRLDI